MAVSSAHGFAWPDGMPPCAQCGQDATNPIHITPGARRPGLMMQQAAVTTPGHVMPLRQHAYVTRSGAASAVPCTACGQRMAHSLHPIGAPSGIMLRDSRPLPSGAVVRAQEDPAFAAEVDGKLILATRAAVETHEEWPVPDAYLREQGATSGAHLWVAGRYVEADNPNRNSAYWSTADLQMGQPSVAHGPINWLHEERHVIGAIAQSQFVTPTRQAAAEGVGNHISVLGAVWPWIYPREAAIIKQASDQKGLYFSMECISKQVACLEEGCASPVMEYGAYMREKASRCEHMQAGAPRRFVDPTFVGAGIIVPPVRPGWANADARVLDAASELVDRQAAAFSGLETATAEALVTQMLCSAALD